MKSIMGGLGLKWLVLKWTDLVVFFIGVTYPWYPSCASVCIFCVGNYFSCLFIVVSLDYIWSFSWLSNFIMHFYVLVLFIKFYATSHLILKVFFFLFLSKVLNTMFLVLNGMPWFLQYNLWIISIPCILFLLPEYIAVGLALSLDVSYTRVMHDNVISNYFRQLLQHTLLFFLMYFSCIYRILAILKCHSYFQLIHDMLRPHGSCKCEEQFWRWRTAAHWWMNNFEDEGRQLIDEWTILKMKDGSSLTNEQFWRWRTTAHWQMT